MAACVLIGSAAVLPTATKSFTLYLRRTDEAMSRAKATPTFSIKEASYSATLGSGECQMENVDARSDEQ